MGGEGQIGTVSRKLIRVDDENRKISLMGPGGHRTMKKMLNLESVVHITLSS